MYRGHSGSTVRSHNRALLLRLLLQNEPISRIELASITGLTSPTVHSLIKELIQDEIVEELGTTEPQGGGPGRKAALLGLRSGSRFSIGIDIGVRVNRIGLLDLKGNLVAERQVMRQKDEDPEDTLERILTAVKDAASIVPAAPSAIVGIGIGIPGLVEVSTGTIRRCPNLGWHDLSIGMWFQERLNLPVIVDNNIRAMAVGERLFGAGREVANLITFFVGPGIGAGILLRDQLYRGISDGAGEIGHTLIDPNGPRCSCGRRGCLEAVASGTAVIREAMAAVKANKDADLRYYALQKLGERESGELTIEDIVHLARTGNSYCRLLLERAACFLGEGVANLINLFNPELVIVGGEIFQDNKLVLDRLISIAREQAFSVPADAVSVVKTEFGKRQGVIGAAGLALKEFLYSSSISQTPINYSNLKKGRGQKQLQTG